MPYNPFDEISDDEWKAAAKPALVSSNPFDAISDDEWQTAAVKPKKQKNLFSLGATVRGVARGADSIVGGIEKFVPESRRFFDANKQQVGERMTEPVNFDPFKAFSADPGDYELAKRAATTLGGARVLDSALNFLPNVYDAAMVKPRQVMDALGTAESLGMPIDPLVRSRFQSLPRSRVAQALYANSPEYQRLAEKYPGTFEAQQAVSQTVMPVPGRAGELLGRGSVLNKNFLTRTADAALSQGAIGAGQALENANLKGQEASAGDILAGFAGGAVLGGGFNALGEGAGKVVDLVGKAIKRRKFAEIAERAKDPAIAQQVLSVIDRQIAAGQIDMSDPEIAEGINLLRQQSGGGRSTAMMGLEGQAAPARVVNPVDEAIGEVETAGPLSLKDAIENAKAKIKEVHGKYDEAGRAASEKKLEAAIAVNEEWQLVQARARGGEDKHGYPGQWGQPHSLEKYKGLAKQEAPQGPEGLQYPDYLDLSTENPATWSMRDYLDVNQSPEGLRFPDYLDLQQEPKAAPTMGNLADDLAGPSTGSVDVDPFEVALARVRNAPNEMALKAAIEEASKLIPKGAPKDYKKLLRGRLNDAYNTYQDRTSGKVLSGGVEEVQAPPAQDPLAAMRQEETAGPMTAAEPGASNDYQPKRRLSESETHDLIQKEYQLFPQHNFPILMYNRGKGTGHSIRVSPKNLTDEVLDQTLEYGEASLKMKSFPSHDKTRIRKEMQAVLDEKMRREFRRSQNLTEDWEGGIEDMSYHSPERLADIIGNGAEDDPRVLEASHELISRNTRQSDLKRAEVSRSETEGISVTANGKAIVLTGEKAQKYLELKAEYDRRVELAGGDQSRRRSLGELFAADLRRLTDQLTGREAEAAKKIQAGDIVSYNGQEAEVMAPPAFGKTVIRLSDGAEVRVPHVDLKKVRARETAYEFDSRMPQQAPAQENPFDAITDEEMKAAGITPEVVPVEGNARRLLDKKEGRRNVGYMQAEDGVPLSDLPQTLQGQVREHTQAAARAKEIEQQLEWLNDDIYKLLGGDGQEQVKYGAFTYKPRKIEVVLSGIAEALKNKIVDALAHGTKDEVKYATRTVVSNPQDWVQRIDPRMEVDELNNVVKGLKDELSRLDKVLKEQRRGLAGPLKGMAVNDTLEINGKSVRVSVKQVNNRMERELSPEAKELVKKWEDRVKALAGKYTKTKDSGMVPGKSSSPNVRIAQALLTGGGAALTQTNAAFAADGRPMSEEDRKVGAMVRAAGWLLFAGGTLPLMKATLRGKYGKVVSFFEDTLGHAEKLDEFLGLKGKDGLFWKINEHNAAAAQASWGVKFDSQNQKAEALGLLTSGKITANQALDPTLAKGTPFEHMSQEQKAAVIAYWASRKTLGAKVREYNAMLKSKLDDPNLTPAQRDEIERLHGQAITAVQNLDTSLNSRGLKPTQLEEMLVNRAAANVMDAFFLWNPQHHALNTLDSVIMGTFGFGAKRMLRAQADMANPRVRKLMEDSNLFGSFRAERTNIAATAQQNRGPVNFEDLGSDTFNANRVALMAWSEYFDLNRNNIPARDYLEMVEKLLSNQLPQDQAMDAWVHMMERSSRFLGVDPLRVNKNALQQGTLFKLVMSFASQPMRVARLMHHYNQKGDYAALARLTSILVLIGGTAAIPKEVQIGMEYLDPDGAQVVEATLNGISVPGMVANNIPGAAPFVPALNEKLEISPTAPIAFGAMNIAGGVVGQAAGGLMKAAVSASRGDTEGAIRDGYKGAKGALQAAVPRIGPIPVGESIRLGEDIAESATGKMKYHNFLANPFNPGDSKRIGGGEIDLDKIPGGRGMPLVDHLAPGIPAVIYQQKKAETADYLAKKAGNKGRLQMDDVNIAGLRFPMSWNDPLKGLAKSK